MSNRKIEIILHVDETLAETRQETLVSQLECCDGISHAHFTPHRPHLMVVDYDPEETHSLDVLNWVQRDHLHAELVGGI